MATSTTVNDNNTTVIEDVVTTTTNATVNLNNSSGSDDVTTDGTGSTTINANNSTGADTFDIDNSGAATVNLNNSTGGDDVSIIGTNVAATANLNNSAGNDTITIVGSSSTNATVNLNNSGGNDDVNIGSSTGATTATVNLNSSGGTDIINVTGLTTTATVNLANSTGADDFVELKGAGTGTINAVNSTGNDTLLGENSTDTITGGVGNDTLYLKGAGTINAGAGNDLGIYVLSDHYSLSGSTLSSINGDVDYYYGQAGTNTLVLVLTPAQMALPAVATDIANYNAFLASNPGVNQTYTFHFGAGSGALVVAGCQRLVIQDTALSLAPVKTLVGSAGATTVAFVVSGINEPGTGTLTVTDGVGTTAETVTANGTFSFNLSGSAFGDGSVTSSLTFTDGIGNTFTASGSAVTLDKDTGETATLSLTHTLIGSAGASTVSFTITGLDTGDTGPGNTGTVSFVEGGSTVTVGVTGDGTYAANLSRLADGTVSDSLSFTDVAGNSFSATGTGVTLDKDTGETVSVSPVSTLVGSAGAGAVEFVVSGLDNGDDSGSLTLSDSGGGTTVLGVTANGTYTANLSAGTFGDGTVSSSLTVTDTAGNSFSATGTGVTLDKDTGETAALLIANPTESVGSGTATFTITGLTDDTGGGNTGTVNFVEGTRTIAVGVTGNGTYTANLSGLPDGTVTDSLTFTDTAGNSFSATGNSVTITGTALALTSVTATASKDSITGDVVDVFTGTVTITAVIANPKKGSPFTGTATVTETASGGTLAWSITDNNLSNKDTVVVTAADGHGDTVSTTITASAPAGIAGSPINLALTDPAAGESVTVAVAGVPTGWSLNGGTNNNGAWTVVTTDPSTLAVTTPATFAGATVLAVSESWTNADGSTESQFVADNVEAYPASPIFAVSGDDTLTGAGANDEFVFAQPIGNDTVYNFNAASDQIDLIGFGISGFAALQSSIADDANGNAVVTLGQNKTITLVGIDATALSASNFVFDQEPISNNTGTMSIGDGAMLPLGGTIDNTGTIAIDSTGDESDLEILVRGATLQGGGQVVLSDNSQNIVFGGDPSAILTNVDNTISGAGQLGNGQLTLDNEGIIDATGTNALVIDTGANTVTNSGTLEATGAGGLDIKSALANTGTLWANGGNVAVEGAETGGGSAEISGSGILEFGAASDAAVTFDATAAGTLKLDQSANFSGTVAGLGQGNSLDLADIAFGAGTTVAYTANAAGTGGTLAVSDGAHTANLALLGQYAAAGFQTSADQGGGTVVIYSSQVAQQPLLTNPQQHA